MHKMAGYHSNTTNFEVMITGAGHNMSGKHGRGLVRILVLILIWLLLLMSIRSPLIWLRMVLQIC